MMGCAPHYFLMTDDVNTPGRWFLVDPTDRKGRELGWLLADGQPVEIEGPVRVDFNKFAKRGRPVDYCDIDVYGIPVVHVRVGAILADLAPSDVQLFPAEIQGQPDQFLVVNVTRLIKCIDEKASRHVEVYTRDDGEQYANFIGQYRDVRGLRINKSKVDDAKVFRTWGWPQALIVSDEIKQALERIGTVGVRFEEV